MTGDTAVSRSGPGATAEEARLTSLKSAAGAVLIAVTVLASMVGFLDASVINVALPAIGRDLHASLPALQWTLTSYLLTVAALLLVAGALADRFGRRRMLIIGLGITLVSSVLCAVAPTTAYLIAARVGQGVGGALVVPASLALLNSTLRVQDRARGIGVWAGLATLGSTVGPYAGGWLVDHASWRWLFILNVPLILCALIAVRRIPEARQHTRLSPDVRGGLLAVVGLGGVTYAFTEGAAGGWLATRVLIAAGAGLLCLIALVPSERRVRFPMLRLSLFSSGQFNAINASTILFYGAISGAGLLFTLHCELQLSYSPAQAGAAFIPMSVIFLALSPASGALVGRVGPRWLMTAGIFAVALALAWLSAAGPGTAYLSGILPALLLEGLGLGLAVTPWTAAVFAAVTATDLGEASAVNNAASRLGGVIAIAALPAVAGATGGRSLAGTLSHGYAPAMIVSAGLCAGAALIAALFVFNQPAPAPRLAPPPPHGAIHILRHPAAGTPAAPIPSPEPAITAGLRPTTSPPGRP